MAKNYKPKSLVMAGAYLAQKFQIFFDWFMPSWEEICQNFWMDLLNFSYEEHFIKCQTNLWYVFTKN